MRPYVSQADKPCCGIIRAEAAGYPVIGHVHDEIIAELPKGQGDLRAFERLICELPPWAAGLPAGGGGNAIERIDLQG